MQETLYYHHGTWDGQHTHQGRPPSCPQITGLGSLCSIILLFSLDCKRLGYRLCWTVHKKCEMLACQRENNCTAHSKKCQNLATTGAGARGVPAQCVSCRETWRWWLPLAHRYTTHEDCPSRRCLGAEPPKIAVDHVSRTPASSTRSCKWPPPGEMWGGAGRSMRC